MDVDVKVDGVMVLTGAAVAGATLLYLNRGALREVVTRKINPASDENLVYESVNDAGAAVTGDQHFSLGVWVWELLHPDQVYREKQVTQ